MEFDFVYCRIEIIERFCQVQEMGKEYMHIYDVIIYNIHKPHHKLYIYELLINVVYNN